ncbi:unannotated protein [freshwater metagenome]|uniref:Unannotated protein n=1 Tax=freshwater metagenome TaxID=449393 RepID=A0A6J6SQA5_9ZZZZ
MGELPLAAEAGDLAGEEPAPAWAKFALTPFLVEEGERELTSPIGHDRLEDGSAALLHLTNRHLLDVGEDRDGRALFKGRELGEGASLGVAARVVAQEVVDGGHAEGLLKRLGGLAPHHRGKGFGQSSLGHSTPMMTGQSG